MASTSPALLTPELTPSHSVTSSPVLPPTPDTQALNIVVAHYNEDLDWLSPYSDLASVYSKGEPPTHPTLYRDFKHLPNLGRESHTYLYHISHNYETLADVTLFFQGNIHDTNDGTPGHTKLSLEEIIDMAKRLTDLPDLITAECAPVRVQMQTRPGGGILPLGKVNTFSDWDGLQYLPGWIERRGAGLQSSKYTPAQFWNYILHGTASHSDPNWKTPPSKIRWTQGALLAVTRQTIQRRPREVYQRACEYFHAAEKVNPEEGHFMERFWLSILGDGGLEQDEYVDGTAGKGDCLFEEGLDSHPDDDAVLLA